jgi:glycosyltransferase involved in cell wall biosynthesis
VKAGAKKPRVLVFIVAYNAETTLESVLKRIPDSLREFDTEVLVIDDASQDATFEKGREFSRNELDYTFPLTVLFNPVNQGYGGNQKIGYHYAIRENFDVVALVHGDGQYAPEKLPELLKPLIDDESDAVFGSRMVSAFGALKGGMPLYKYVGNRILTFYQNRMLGTRLSEFHSGYRLYSVDALRKIPFHLNANEFHFDTQIIIQFLFAKLRIREIPIPTYYGDEISYVNGMRYAWDVFLSTALAKIQGTTLLYRRWLDVDPPDRNDHYESKAGFDSSHSDVLRIVKDGSRILDIGSGPGHLAKILRSRGCHVTGVDVVRPANEGNFDEFILEDLNARTFSFSAEGYDYVLLLDVIEHLNAPEEFLQELARISAQSPKTAFVVSTGNVAFFVVRLMHLIGHFNYGKKGILDLTHKRLFTFATLRRLLDEAGFRVLEVRAVPGPWTLIFGEGLVGRLLTHVNRALNRILRGLFAYQVVVVAESSPTLDYLLRAAIESSDQRLQASGD